MTATLLAFLMSISALMAPDNEAKLLFAGDAMMHQAQIDDARRSDGTFEFDACFAAVKPQIEAADFAVVNLETPLAGQPYTGYPSFSAPDSYAEALRDAGFDLMLTANNHTLDKRGRGLRRTLDTLNLLGIPHLGTYSSKEQRDTVLPMVVDVKGFKIGFLNYTYGTNGIKADGGVVVDYIDKSLIASDIQAVRAAGAELVAVCIHWGIEYELVPRKDVRDMAHWLEQQGVELIIGGHPHVIQPMEFRNVTDNVATVSEEGKNVFICYSLGNFVSNMRTTDTRGGALATVTLKRDDNGVAYVADAAYSLVFTVPVSEVTEPVAHTRKTRFAVYPADTSIRGEWRERRDAFVRNARRVFKAHNISVPELTYPAD